jgi:hypothetical protein
MVCAGALACGPATAGDGTELQPGGFSTPAYGSAERFENPTAAPQDLGRIEFGPTSSVLYSEGFAPSAVGLALDIGRHGGFLLPEGATAASPALRGPRLPTEADGKPEDATVKYFTPRFSGLQLGLAFTPAESDAREASALRALARQNPIPRRDFALELSFLESFEGVDVALSGAYESASAPTAPGLGEAVPDRGEDLERYSVGTSIGFSGLRLGGSFAREVGAGPITVQSWDAGVSYAAGSWTIGVDYLKSAFIDTSRPGSEAEDELQTVQAGLSYSAGAGIVASVNILHSSLEDSEGKATSGTLGILGFSYNF